MVAILLVPQAIAYAYLAGMPPQYGLYTALIPCILYAMLGTSPHLAVGPVAVSALLVLAGVSVLAEPFSETYISLVILSGLLIGLVQFIMGVFKMGSLVNLLSYPVITGFTSAASIIVIVNQLKDIFGIDIPRSDFLFDTITHIATNKSAIHLPTLITGMLTFIFIIIAKRVSKKIPYGLVIVVLGILFSYYFDFENIGIAVIGTVPSGLPKFDLPIFTSEAMISLAPTVLLVSFIGSIESVGIAKAIENKHDYYNINTNQELRALGISKMLGSFFQAVPSSGSFSRSALMNESGARTSVASIISVGFVVLALLFLTPYLFFLPKVILAVIIVFAVKNLFEFRLAKSFYKTNKLDLMVMLFTFICTLLINIESGILIGFIVSLIAVMICGKGGFHSLKKVLLFQESKGISVRNEGATIKVTIADQLNFGNSDYLKKQVLNLISDLADIDSIQINARLMTDLDSTGIKTISHLHKYASSNDISFVITNQNKKVIERLNRAGIKI